VIDQTQLQFKIACLDSPTDASPLTSPSPLPPAVPIAPIPVATVTMSAMIPMWTDPAIIRQNTEAIVEQFGVSLQTIERVTEFEEIGPEDRTAIETVRERMRLSRISGA
jgi:hypothetical protein